MMGEKRLQFESMKAEIESALDSLLPPTPDAWPYGVPPPDRRRPVDDILDSIARRDSPRMRSIDEIKQEHPYLLWNGPHLQI
jgi:hypothetical protein